MGREDLFLFTEKSSAMQELFHADTNMVILGKGFLSSGPDFCHSDLQETWLTYYRLEGYC